MIIAVVGLALVACGSGGGDSATPTPGSSTGVPGSDDVGGALYATHCAACHGPAGEGEPDWQVRKANGRLPAPPHDASGHTWHHADGLLFRIVRDGCAAYGVSAAECDMPAYGEILTGPEIRAVIEYLRGWWGVRELEFQATVSERDPFPPEAGP